MKFLFLPNHPEREYYSLVAIFKYLGYTATKSPHDEFDAAFLWQDTTHVMPPPALLEIARSKPVLNLGCTDISKTRVEQLSIEVFGYGTFVDPTLHRGRCIVKSDENAVGWGSVVQGPLEAAQEGCIYQVFIDSEHDGAQVEYRTPVILGTIPEVKVWRREAVRGPINQRAWLDTSLSEAAAVYTPRECELILEFCRSVGLDFGELDILRSRDDGRIYILDVNKTPSEYSMLNRVRWRPEDRRRSLANLASCLDRRLRELLAKKSGSGILELRLETGALREQKLFYTQTLGLPLLGESNEQFTVLAGTTRLTFAAAAHGNPTYHFAFDIPENKIMQAKEWLEARTPILTQDGQGIVHFPAWNAHAVYFHDPAGNVAELIARHDLQNAAPGPLSAEEILYASEIGLVVDDVPAEVKALGEALGLAVYRPGSERFAPVGDEHRLLILNHRDRGWWEDTPSRPYPVFARLSGEGISAYRSQHHPYTIEIQGSGSA